jgi:hypothetical protein
VNYSGNRQDKQEDNPYQKDPERPEEVTGEAEKFGKKGIIRKIYIEKYSK